MAKTKLDANVAGKVFEVYEKLKAYLANTRHFRPVIANIMPMLQYCIENNLEDAALERMIAACEKASVQFGNNYPSWILAKMAVGLAKKAQ